MPATQHLASPFDDIAASYDEIFTASTIGRSQRAAVWRDLTKAFHAGDRVLEIGCGTGVDACCLAERGVKVLALDPSSQMIEVASRRIRQNGLQALVDARVLCAEDICILPKDEFFDGAFSNFGALNCVKDLRAVALGLGKLLRPGATVLLCWMGPCCLWEVAWYLASGNATKAFRRFKQGGVRARFGHGESFEIRYPSAAALANAFAGEFRLKSVRGVGVAVPPSYLEPWARKYPRALGLCRRFDLRFGHWPGIRTAGDHVLVQLQRMHPSGER